MTFKTDLEFGNKYEQEFIKYLGYDDFKIMEGYFKEYDVEINIDNKIIYFEVKADRLTKKTNNICIEFQCNNIPSGITTTKANHYAYYEVIDETKHNLYIIPTNTIKKNIMNKTYNKIIYGGDNGKSRFYLFNKDIYSKYLREI
jgi:hypothetical protein